MFENTIGKNVKQDKIREFIEATPVGTVVVKNVVLGYGDEDWTNVYRKISVNTWRNLDQLEMVGSGHLTEETWEELDNELMFYELEGNGEIIVAFTP